MIIDRIKKFLSTTTAVSLGYNELNFPKPRTLKKYQVGYSIRENGESLITGEEGHWQKNWLVIGNDQMGDPIIVDTDSPELSVLSAMHGQGSWEPFLIADSLDCFENIIALLLEISKGRTDPADLENNPVTKKERRNILKEITKQNPGAERWYWESFFEE